MPSYTVPAIYSDETPNGANEGTVWVNSTTGVVQVMQNGAFRTPRGPGTIPIVARTPATVTTAGAATYTAAQLLGGLILRDPNGAARSDVTPTAALIIAAMLAAVGSANINDTFEFTLVNTADAAETLTVTAGANVTLVPATIELDQNQNARFVVRVVTATTVAMYVITAGGT